MKHNGLDYEWMCVLAVNLVSTHQTENLRGFSEVSQSQQLLIVIVVPRFFIFINLDS